MRVPGTVFTKTSLVYFSILLNYFVVTFTDRMVNSGMQLNFTVLMASKKIYEKLALLTSIGRFFRRPRAVNSAVS